MSCKLHHNIIMSCGHTVAVYSGHSKKECQRNVSQCGRKCIDCAIAAQDIRILKLFDSSQNSVPAAGLARDATTFVALSTAYYRGSADGFALAEKARR